ncbi:unnamed protein product [Moneuplotes crassus]|uniref:Uncharacterized protein n=1 Tax=Euplotes crassus TaxID=5936 RepID=A0AAD1XS27_EUPCR|nr:unnamed protein product [Moneuplotes crassus]
MSIGKFEGNNLFSYDLSEMRDHIRNKSFLAKRKKKNSNLLPFIILSKKDKSPSKKLNLKLKKEGIEMVNAVKRRKETQRQHKILENRIKHLQVIEKKENDRMKKIQSQIEKFNLIRKVRSEYFQKRIEMKEKFKEEQDQKYKAAQSYKKQIEQSIKQKRQDLVIRNRRIMEEIMRNQDLYKLKKKKLPVDKNKSEYRNRIAREKLEANSFNRKVQDLERVENDLIERLEDTQDHRRTLMDEYNSLVQFRAEEKH